MPKVSLAADINKTEALSGGVKELKLQLVPELWHAAFAGGSGAFDVSAGFAAQNTLEADRIPELALTGGGTPGDYVITGTWNSAAQTETITTVAGATVKGTKPFDTVTNFAGPDPGGAKDVTLYMGDSYCNPASRAMSVGTAGVIACELDAESAVSPKTCHLPGDWQRRAQRVEHDGTVSGGTGRTTAVALAFVW